MNELIRTALNWLNEFVVGPIAGLWAVLDPEQRLVLHVLLGVAAAFGAFISRRRLPRIRIPRLRGFQNYGEALVAAALKESFQGPDYHLLNHVTLPLSDSTTQVDHILVSRFGVFVIETKHYRGWIFASPESRKWTQVLFRARFGFQNPLFQNRKHVRAVQNLLDFIPREEIRSVVVFTGSAEFKTDIPSGVFMLDELEDYVSEFVDEVMTLNHLQYCVGRLETARLEISEKTDLEHVAALRERYGRRYR